MSLRGGGVGGGCAAMLGEVELGGGCEGSLADVELGGGCEGSLAGVAGCEVELSEEG